jgi:hypothetical protein
MATSVSLVRGTGSARLLSIGTWTLQVLLALIFAFSGGMKLTMPADMLEAQTPLPLALVRFIGLCEVAGALGLILPGLVRIRPNLTPLAAAGLVVLMICATILTPVLISADPVMMLIPAIVGVLAGVVAYARWRVIPLRGRTGRRSGLTQAGVRMRSSSGAPST